ncbi:mechanosensitive ion channel family protein [Pantanalinema sp. GBBB05]|uniref:mechanosensitive ion channel family protein n=1 Tax=Pantanalinema sp. GBBB05 TaxID=2604139 RepID=UPI001DF5BD3C|nr:mechanosensitive ion channel family protein [Pantanalinema sp. GBBB05]
MPLSFRRLLTLVLAAAIALVVTLSVGSPVQAQFSLPEGLGQNNNISPPAKVTRYGNLETMAVESPLSFRTLFTIASPTIYDRSPAALAGRQTVEQRAQEIGARLLLLLNRPMNPETLGFDVSQLNNVKIIRAQDTRFTEPLVLMSVTELDAQFNGLPVEQLAEQWRRVLEQELRTGLNNLPQNQQRIQQILLWLVLLTSIVVVLKSGLSRHQKQLRRQKQAVNTAVISPELKPLQSELMENSAESALGQMRNQFLQRLLPRFSLDRQLGMLDLVQWLLFWLLIFAWYGGGLWVAMVSPYLISGQFRFIEVPIDLLGICFFTGLLIRVSRWLIDHFAVRWQRDDLANFISLGDGQRHRLRTATIAGATKGMVTIGLLLLGGLWALGAIGIPTASTVAILGLLALAISFGSRRLVEDLVNGFLILAEDQFAIGDYIDLGTVSGLVENLNLRVTQLRSGRGEMITIPNSKISEVRNLTRGWSRIDFSIDVAYRTDPDLALAVMQEVAQELYNDPAWHDQIVSEPKVLGIDRISHNGMTMTTWIETQPGQQWSIGREFRLRVRRALAENGIEIGTPQQTYVLEPPFTPSNHHSQKSIDDNN